MIRRFAATLLLCSPVLAQGDPMAMSRMVSANQLGVLEYCQSRGYVDQDAVTAQKSVIARLPASPGAAAPGAASPGAGPTDAAEATGRQGMMFNNVSLPDMATRANTTVDALCKQMGSAVTQMAARFGSSGMPVMPTMPGGMPAMPNGMPAMPNGMPAMPGGMPAMPGTAR